MGLFTKKKEEQKSGTQWSETQDVFPDFPTASDDFLEFPTYEPTIKDIKSEVGKGSEDDTFEVPQRESNSGGKKLVGVNSGTKLEQPKRIMGEEKPIFVQVDRYKEVISTLNVIKTKLDDVDNLLNSLDRLKSEEDKKLDLWKKDLQTIKDKIISIDKELFEV